VNLANKSKDKDEEQEPENEVLTAEEVAIMALQSEPNIRAIGLCGDIEEEKIGELIGIMLGLRETGLIVGDDQKINRQPIEFLVSTTGGSAHEMFALYDVMRIVRNDTPIHTLGLGKVMSAGVLLLAGGTKGHRKIGKNCRVMIHGVIGGNAGMLHNLENEMDEIRQTQEQYIEALVKETDMTKRLLKKLIERKVNVYLTAAEAVEYGIADEVI
jgi:ATP-dependent Clp endopeptidase proteolytic subunit ClpP